MTLCVQPRSVNLKSENGRPAAKVANGIGLRNISAYEPHADFRFMHDKPKQVAGRISLSYGLAGAIWILVSDRIVAWWLPDIQHLSHFQTFKGLGFIFVTALLLYAAIRFFLRERERERAGRAVAEETLAGQQKVLELIATETPLPETLHTLAQALEAQLPNELVSILLLDDRDRLRHGAAPSLPKAFCNSIDGARIGPETGSCGTAAYRGEPVIVADIQTSPLWKDWRALAAEHQLRACWSTPILDEQKRVLGTFAIYSRAVSEPTRRHHQLIDSATHLAAIAIARQRAHSALIKSEERYRNLTDAAADSFFVHDERGNFLEVNRRACDSLGYPREELLKLNLTNVEMELSQPALEKVLQQLKPGQARTLVGTHRRKNGSEFPVEVRLGSFEADGRVLYHSLARDITDRKRAADALEMFRTLVDRVNDAIEVIDPETGQFLDINEKTCLDLGYAREELLSLSYPDVDPQTDMAAFRRHKERLWDTGALIHESTHRRKDGSTFPVEVSMKWVWLDRDYIVAVVRDITERRKTEAALRSSEERLRACIDNTPNVAVQWYDAEGRVLYWNAASESMFGWTQAEAMGKTLEHLIQTPEQAEQFRRTLQDAGRTNNPIGPLEFNFRRKDGREGICLSTLFTIPAPDGGHHFVCMDVDLTERKRAEAELRKREVHFRLLIENASDIITVINHAGVIQFQSPSVMRILGHQPEEMVGRSVFDYLHPDDVARVGPAIQRGAQNPGLPVSVEYRFRHQDGSWRFIQSVGRSVPSESPDGFIIVNSRDITETCKLEEQFRQSQKMEAIGQLAGGVAHDLNNILTVVHMQLDLLKHGDPLTTAQSESVMDIEKASRRAADLTRQLLMFSRRQAALKGNLDLNAVVTNITKMLQRIVGEDVGMHISYAPQPLPVHADAGMLDQVLLNLAVNSRDAMPGGGRLIIETAVAEFDEFAASQRPNARPGKFACLSVSDTGKGIPPEILPRIYEPFFTTKDIGKGTGLGLATVFGIVQQHHGWISVYSEIEKGTTFRIYLPLLATPTDVNGDTQHSGELRGGTETILLVEDEQSLRVLVRNVLTRLGYRVLEATTGVTALEVWKEHQQEIRLLLTDLVMPDGMTGKALAEQVVAQNPKLKVIYTSGYSREIAGKDFPLQDGVNFLSKPFQAAKLAQAVRHNLDAN